MMMGGRLEANVEEDLFKASTCTLVPHHHLHNSHTHTHAHTHTHTHTV